MFKKILAVSFILILIFSLTSCAGGNTDTASSPSPSPASASDKQDEIPPGEVVPPGQKSPPDCIWTINGTVEGSVDIAAEQGLPGMSVNYIFDLLFYKTDGNYPSGQYSGSIYVHTKLEASDAILNLLKNLPGGMMDTDFNLEAYSLRRLFIMNVYNYRIFEDKFVWLQIFDESGNSVIPASDEYASQSRVSLKYKSEGGALGIDIQGEKILEMRFIIEPNTAMGDAFYTTDTGSRKVKIYLGYGESWITGEGTLTRQPGGEENVSKYLAELPSLGDKYGVEPTD